MPNRDKAVGDDRYQHAYVLSGDACEILCKKDLYFMGIWYWKEEHKVGEPHYHIYCDELSQKELHEKIIETLDKLRYKHGLVWRDAESVWDEINRRMYIQVSLVRQKASIGRGRPYRIHITTFDRARVLFMDLMQTLEAVETVTE